MSNSLDAIQEAYLYLLSLDEHITESYDVRDVKTKDGTRTMISAEAAIRRAKELAGKSKVTREHLKAAIKELTDTFKNKIDD